MVGISTNGTSRLPTIAPIVLTARSEPGLAAGVRRSSREQRRRGREGDRRARSSTGRTTSTAEPNSASSVVERLAGVERLGRDETTRARAATSAADDDLAQRPAAAIGSPSRGRMTSKSRAPIASPTRNIARIDREDVGRVAGPRGQQPRPRDLVAERRQARDEGDRRARARGRGASPARTGLARCVAAATRRRSTVGGRRRPIGARRRRRSPAAAAREPERREPGDGRAAGADGQRAGQPEQLDEDEAGDQRPDDRPDRVRRVQPAERPAQARRSG